MMKNCLTIITFFNATAAPLFVDQCFFFCLGDLISFSIIETSASAIIEVCASALCMSKTPNVAFWDILYYMVHAKNYVHTIKKNSYSLANMEVTQSHRGILFMYLLDIVLKIVFP